MATIGLIGGGEARSAMRFLKELYANSNRCLKSFSFDDNLNYANQTFDIIIINSDKLLDQKLSLVNFSDSGIIIANADCRNIFKRIRSSGRKTNLKLITYGLNSKSCVTASSVASSDSPDGAVEKLFCCIQRSIPTLSGELLDEQEFSVQRVGSSCGGHPHVDTILAAVTAALVGGVGIDEISNPSIMSHSQVLKNDARS